MPLVPVFFAWITAPCALWSSTTTLERVLPPSAAVTVPQISLAAQAVEHAAPVLEQGVPQLSVPTVVAPQAGTGALQLPSGVQAQAGPVLEQLPPQLSTPVVVNPQAGTGALQVPSRTQAQAGPVLEQGLPQLSDPDEVDPQAGAGALQVPLGTQVDGGGGAVQVKSPTHWYSDGLTQVDPTQERPC